MNQRRQRIIAVAAIASMALSGCSRSSSMRLQYNSTSTEQGQFMELAAGQEYADLMSTDLCVVPTGEDHGDDESITGAASLLFDITNKKVIYADNVYTRLYPASLTKVLTALTVLDQYDLTQVVTVSHNAANIKEAGAKLCGLKEGDQIVLGDLLTALLVYSGNDAGIAIADFVAGSEKEFCKIMNEKAASIGAIDTHFVNSHGLHSEEHYTTAYDLYLIFQALLEHEQALDMITRSSYTMKYKDAKGNEHEKVYANTNRFLKGEVKPPEGITVEGGKTGTTNAAGHCLEVVLKDQKGNSYIALVMKAANSDHLYQQMNRLFEKSK